jgi:hypothetical protein
MLNVVAERQTVKMVMEEEDLGKTENILETNDYGIRLIQNYDRDFPPDPSLHLA